MYVNHIFGWFYRSCIAGRAFPVPCCPHSPTRLQGWLVNDLSFALCTPPALDSNAPGVPPEARADRVCAAVSAMCDIAPRDTLEGMLAAQMVAVHSAALDSLRRAAEAGAADRARDCDLRHVARLLNVF